MAPRSGEREDGAPLRHWAAWLRTHLLVGAGTLGLVLLLRMAGPGGRTSTLWNPALGHAAVVLIGLTLLVGPLARLWPRTKPLLEARRELGIWAGLASLAHVVLALDEWAGWSLGPLWRRFDGQHFSLDAGLAMANLVGALAAGYALVLLATSNDVAQRWLGPRWSRIQAGATTLFLLAALHGVYFLFLSGPSLGGLLGAGPYGHGILRTLFLGVLGVVAVVRTWAFWARRPR